MYGCESCTIKKAECRRIDAFELWCWTRLFFLIFKKNLLSARFSSTYTKIGMIQRRLTWPLRKDDMQIREAFHIFSSTKEARIYNGKKTASLTSGAGKTGQPLAKE